MGGSDIDRVRGPRLAVHRRDCKIPSIVSTTKNRHPLVS